MNKSISQRDKKILFFVALFVVAVAGIKFLALPTFNNIKEAKKQNIVLIEQQQKMENEINNLEAYKRQLKNIDIEYINTKEKVFNNFKEYDMDKSLTQIMNDNGVEPTRLNINSVNGITIESYNSKSVGEDSKFGIISDDNSKIKAANVTITSAGPAKNALKLLNAIDSQSGIFIQQSDISFSADQTKITVDVSLILGDNDF